MGWIGGGECVAAGQNQERGGRDGDKDPETESEDRGGKDGRQERERDGENRHGETELGWTLRAGEPYLS